MFVDSQLCSGFLKVMIAKQQTQMYKLLIIFCLYLLTDKPDAPIRYDGGRELDDFITYIAKHATNELKSYERSGKPKNKEEL